MRPDLTLEEYRQWVARFYGYYAPLEKLIGERFPEEAATLPYSDRIKAPALRLDLLALGFAEAEIESLPLARQLPEETGPGSFFGIAYVIEGATLGGQIITKHLQKILPVSADAGCSFFAGYGAETSPRWKSFLGTMEAETTDEARQDNAVTAAVQTFSTMRDWLLKRED